MRSVYELSTEEAYRLVSGHFGPQLPPLDAVENEDWGRDYVLQHLLRHTAAALAAVGLTWEPEADEPLPEERAPDRQAASSGTTSEPASSPCQAPPGYWGEDVPPRQDPSPPSD